MPRPSQEFERTLYLPVLRNGFAGPDRIRNFFDFVNPAQTAGQRPQTVVPTQALFLLNNELLRKRAGTLAKKLSETVQDRDARIAELWLRVLNRPASSEERHDAVAFLDKLAPLFKDKPLADSLAWHELCHSLLASNLFLFRL